MVNVTDLIGKYSRDFSTDQTYGQLSVVDIMRESIAEVMARIPEINALPENRKEEIEDQILLFGLTIHDDAKS